MEKSGPLSQKSLSIPPCHFDILQCSVGSVNTEKATKC